MTTNPFRQDDDLTAMIRDIIAGKRPEAKPVEEGSKEEYQAFFQAALKKFGVDSPADFKSDEEKKKFFDYVDKNYKGEKSEEAEPCPECGKIHEGNCSEEKVEEAKKKDEDVTINVDDEEDEDDDEDEDEKKKKKDDVKVNPDEPKTSDVEEAKDDIKYPSLAQMKKRDEIYKTMAKKLPEFKKRYGDNAKAVMLQIALKMAMEELNVKEEVKAEKGETFRSILRKIKGD
jgi:hypothetical protein